MFLDWVSSLPNTTIEDLRSKGGCLWILSTEGDVDILRDLHEQLSVWGVPVKLAQSKKRGPGLYLPKDFEDLEMDRT